MNKLVEELRDIMEEKDLSMETAGRFLDSSTRSIQRWVSEGFIPSLISKRKIREGIERIKKAYPEKKSRLKVFKKTKEFYLKIQDQLTEEEKEKVQEVHMLKGPESSFKMLQELEEKYRQDNKRQVQMFRSVDENGKK